MIKKIVQKLWRIFESPYFLVGVLVIFTVQAAWIAISAHLLPYDEYYHLGIIRFYANQWSPFISEQPFEMSLYGDITRLPSYVYQYLMSFPYRIFDGLFGNERLTIVLLRFMNIAMVVGAVLLFKRLFTRIQISKRITQVAIAVFLFLPITPILAAQNNYDNLMLLITPLFLGYAYELARGKIQLRTLLLFGLTGMFATLTKHNFIVVFFAFSLYIFVLLVWKFRQQFLKELRHGWQKLAGGWRGVLLITLFVLVFGLFMERYGVNAVRYGQVKIDCAKIQPVEVCENFSPWRRNQAALARNLISENLYSNPVSFSIHWVTTITRGFVALYANVPREDPNHPDPYGHYVFKPVLPLALTGMYLLFGIGFTAIIIKIKKVWNNEFFKLSLLGFLTLAGALWIFNYAFYLKYGRAYAVQARYLLPFMLPLLVVMFSCAREVLTPRIVKQLLTIGLVSLFIYTGGIMGWLVSSAEDWYIDDQRIVQTHKNLKSTFRLFIIRHFNF